MKIEIWSDYVCPFCYIGKRKLEKALENYRGDVEIEFKAFQLDPNAKTEDNLLIDEVLAKKYRISIDEARKMNNNVAFAAKQVGIDFNLNNMKYPNTFIAHRLIKHAKSKGLDKVLSEKLFSAHFTEAKNIGLKETLLGIANSINLDGANEVIDSNMYSDLVLFDQKEARDFQIHGVPFFVFNRKYAISGAQSLSVFENTIKKVSEEEKKQNSFKVVSDDDNICNDNGCKI